MIAVLVKATVALLVTLGFVVIARRSRASLRHLTLSALFAFLLLLPVVQKFAPSVNIELQRETVQKVREQVAQPLRPLARPAATLSPGPAGGNGAAYLYAGICALLLLHLTIGIVRLRRLAAKARVWLEGTARMNAIAHEADIRRPALVVLSRDVSSPLTFGFRQATIVLPDSATTWNDEELTHALRHELEHVRREDWLLQLAARAACAVYWFHPLVWIAWRRFCLEAERACDDAVIDSCAPDAYATQLVTLARSMQRVRAVPALAMASRSRLALRIDAILDATQLRGRYSPSTAMAVGVVLLALLVSVAPARLIAAAAAPIANMVAYDEQDVDPNLGEALVKAAEAGDAQDVRRLLDAGLDINVIAVGDGTALIGAARGGQGHLIDFLVERGADPNLAAPGDGSPLIAAAREGYAEIVEQLLRAGAKIDQQVQGDENALMQGAWNGHVEVVRVLIEHGADVNARAYEDGVLRTPLRLARRGGHEDVVRMLVQAGARE
ncbi:MAG TPA: ankyrin repeat domain-containing protein [Thermoanaerobaculia bacterium]|nr:ankyrin repeat domain-containing protein [Thermoanaerobaculia bacterium]